MIITPFVLIASQPLHAVAPKVTLMTMNEARHVVVVEPDDDNTFFMNDTGLTLTFAIELPEGHQIAGVTQPDELTATDSAGTNLADIEPDWSDVREYVTIPMTWDEQPAVQFELNLLTSARGATTFDLDATITIDTFSSTEKVPFEGGTSWTRLDPALFGEGAEARLTDNGVELKPASLRSRVEEAEFTSDGEVMESGGWMSDGRSYTIMPMGSVGDDFTVSFMVRTGFETIEVPVKLDDAPLP